MKAEILSIGTELIIGHTVNTNATFISEILNSIGISTHYHTAVGDNEKRIKECLDYAITRSDLIITTGGLGPTDDDMTHDVLASYCGHKNEIDSKQKTILENKFASIYRDRKNVHIPSINYKQARVIDGAEVIANPIGTAIGMFFEYKGVIIASFPGVPCEMEAMLETILPKLIKKLKDEDRYGTIVSKKIKMANLTESVMAQTIIDHYKELGQENPFMNSNPSLAPYASLGEVYLRVTAQADTEDNANKLINEFDHKLHELFPDNIFGYDDDSLHSVLAKMLREKNLTVSFAESCTGGLASKFMTDIPGSSAYTKINFVTYANEAKEKFLNVTKDSLESFGAVSKEVAKEMVEGLAKVSGANINVSITGIAGPDGASNEKPIGTVYAGIMINGEIRYLDLLPWSNRPLSREQVRELVCIKIFWILINLLD